MDANLDTMNDIDIIYDKEKKTYLLGVETAYLFDSYESECNYLRTCLNAFTKYMDENELNKQVPHIVFMSSCGVEMEADSIEELYTNFRIFVNGFCSLNKEE